MIDVHVTNFGYAYCASHGVDKPGMLADRCGRAHYVDTTIAEGSCPTNSQCDWPGCEVIFNRTEGRESGT